MYIEENLSASLITIRKKSIEFITLFFLSSTISNQQNKSII